MAILTRDSSYNDQITTAKNTFTEYLNRVEQLRGRWEIVGQMVA
jgi:hypothetical protein